MSASVEYGARSHALGDGRGGSAEDLLKRKVEYSIQNGACRVYMLNMQLPIPHV